MAGMSLRSEPKLTTGATAPSPTERQRHSAKSKIQNSTTMSMKITDIAFTGTPVTDMKKARAFYEGVLGLVPGVKFEGEGYCWIEYEIGPGKNTLGISTATPQWQPSPQGTTLGFEVEDFDATIAHLRANNTPVIGEIFDTPVCRMAIIADPDGNSIVIHQCKKNH